MVILASWDSQGPRSSLPRAHTQSWGPPCPSQCLFPLASEAPAPHHPGRCPLCCGSPAVGVWGGAWGRGETRRTTSPLSPSHSFLVITSSFYFRAII